MRINNPSKIAVLLAGLTATSVAVADQVIADDLIVQGSQCVGIDCVNNESFGFDTIRLKENNLRIKFDDTSSSGAFPNVDWQLTANESANGGLNKFSIEDTTNSRVPFTVEASTPNNSLYVDSTGNVGFGTSTPSLNVHAVDSDTPAMRFEQNGSGGFTPQTWDVAGNEANFFVRDVTGGSRLPFRIKPGAPTDSMVIAADGDVGLGTASPEQVLHVRRTGVVLPLFESSDNSAVQMRLKSNDANRRFIGMDGSNVVQSQVVLGNSEIKLAGTTDTSNTYLVANAAGIQVTGSVVTVGGTTLAVPDYVFESSYNLPTIEAHAAAMWRDKHLPKMEPAKYTEQGEAIIDYSANMMGMLEELETAHIYIDQLNRRLSNVEQTNQDLNERIARMEHALSNAEIRMEALQRGLHGVVR